MGGEEGDGGSGFIKLGGSSACICGCVESWGVGEFNIFCSGASRVGQSDLDIDRITGAEW